ncbi:MAG: hypothetical protein ACJ763_15045 [Bdellovibrionia bacterium]
MKAMMSSFAVYLFAAVLSCGYALAGPSEDPGVRKLRETLAQHPNVAECTGKLSPHTHFLLGVIELTCVDSEGKKFLDVEYRKNEDITDIWLAAQMLLRKANLTVTTDPANKKGIQKLYAHTDPNQEPSGADAQKTCEYVDEKEVICHGHRYLRDERSSSTSASVTSRGIASPSQK